MHVAKRWRILFFWGDVAYQWMMTKAPLCSQAKTVYAIVGECSVLHRFTSIPRNWISLVFRYMLIGCWHSWYLRFLAKHWVRVQVSDSADDLSSKKDHMYNYPGMVKQQGNFKLTVQPGNFSDSEIIVMLGENGTGKTTFIRMLAGITQPDSFMQGAHSLCHCPSAGLQYGPWLLGGLFWCWAAEVIEPFAINLYDL